MTEWVWQQVRRGEWRASKAADIEAEAEERRALLRWIEAIRPAPPGMYVGRSPYPVTFTDSLVASVLWRS